MSVNMFEFFRKMIATEDGLILFLLGLIVVMEIVDFLSGTFAAIINTSIEYKSKVGINGLLRKMLGVILLTILIPMSVLLPEQTGVAFLYTIYVGYIILTFKSLVENYGKAKGDTSIFENVTAAFEKLIRTESKVSSLQTKKTTGTIQSETMKADLGEGNIDFIKED
ncbi:phage holin family protein [Streptococcus suis]|uniref:phage holin family protein n=1 Tax=Streptococcus suis TaxID=1307 RepID=UPI00240FA175|nr:phage holin family protein [Streptococcus suis]MDG3137301.1 phage holin family protein [Streptococcus suis]